MEEVFGESMGQDMKSIIMLQSTLKKQKNEELLEAVVEGKMKNVAKLLQSGAEIDQAQNKNGCRALHLAAHNGDHSMLQYLVTWKPELEVRTNLLKLTPLHCAVSAKNRDCVLVLLDAGADFEAQTDAGERPLHLAIMREDAATVKVLLEHGANRHQPCPCVWDSNVPRSTVELAKQIRGNTSDQILMMLSSSSAK